MEAIGGKDAPEAGAPRKMFDISIDKAAAKEDSEELKREKKRVRFEDQTSGPEKSDVDDEVQMETDPKDEQPNDSAAQRLQAAAVRVAAVPREDRPKRRRILEEEFEPGLPRPEEKR